MINNIIFNIDKYKKRIDNNTETKNNIHNIIKEIANISIDTKDIIISTKTKTIKIMNQNSNFRFILNRKYNDLYKIIKEKIDFFIDKI